MPENTVHNYTRTCSALRQAIQDIDVRVRVSQQNQKLRETYEAELSKLEENIALCNGVIDIMKPLLEDVQDYISKRRISSMQNINNALRMAGEIIPDSTEGIYFHSDGDEAWLSTPDGLEVDEVEGGGYRHISSTFIRSTILNSSLDTLNTMLLDEIFATVSTENSVTLSLYLNVICQNMQIISIEQKPQVYSNIDAVMYEFSKNNEYTEVTRKELNRTASANNAEEKGDQSDIQA